MPKITIFSIWENYVNYEAKNFLRASFNRSIGISRVASSVSSFSDAHK